MARTIASERPLRGYSIRPRPLVAIGRSGLARALDCHVRHVDAMVKAGLPAYRIGNKYVHLICDVERFIPLHLERKPR